MRVGILMKICHSFWAKNRLASEAIDLQAPFNDHWSTNEHVFTVPRRPRSPTVRLHLMAKRRGHYFSWKESGLKNYNSLRALPFASLQLHIPASQ